MSTASVLTLASALSITTRRPKGDRSIDPLLTLAQILLLQLFFYLSFVTTYHTFAVLLKKSQPLIFPPKSPLFSHTAFTASNLPPLSLALSLLPTCLIFAVVVADSAKSLDFALTLFGTHWIVVVARSGWPSWKFWLINIAAAVEFVIGAYFMCKMFTASCDREPCPQEDVDQNEHLALGGQADGSGNREGSK